MLGTPCLLLANGGMLMGDIFEFAIIWIPVVTFSLLAAAVAYRRSPVGLLDLALSILACPATALLFVKTYFVKTTGYPSLADFFLVLSCLACIPAYVAVHFSISRRLRNKDSFTGVRLCGWKGVLLFVTLGAVGALGPGAILSRITLLPGHPIPDLMPLVVAVVLGGLIGFLAAATLGRARLLLENDDRKKRQQWSKTTKLRGRRDWHFPHVVLRCHVTLAVSNIPEAEAEGIGTD